MNGPSAATSDGKSWCCFVNVRRWGKVDDVKVGPPGSFPPGTGLSDPHFDEDELFDD